MSTHRRKLQVLVRTLADGQVIVEALGFPGASCLGEDEADALARLEVRVRAALRSTPIRELCGRAPVPDAVRVGQLSLDVHGSTAAVERAARPAQLTLDYASWQQGENAWIAYVPSLRCTHVASSYEQLLLELPDSARDVLERSPDPLLTAARLESELGIVVQEHEVVTQTPGSELKRRWSNLLAVATDLALHPLPPAYEVDAAIAQLAAVLGGRSPGSALLVGASGIGKTAMLGELARRHREFGLDRTRFFATSASRLVAGMTGAGMWQDRCLQLLREVRGRRIILQVGHLRALVDAGKHEHSDLGIAALWRPAISRREIQLVVECTPEELATLERDEPHLLDAFQRVDVREPTLAQTRRILQSVASDEEAIGSAAIDTAALDTIHDLHCRYAAGRGSPGGAIAFLRRLLAGTAAGAVVRARDVTRAFGRESGLPGFLLNPDERLDLRAAEQWLSDRVRGQAAAVSQVLDVVATIKARITRPGQPIASLLFAGPTGVGKTQMARSLAELLFGEADRLFRLDMSEYADVRGAARLLQANETGEVSFTARMREQPFSVLLLDEIEKAHPRVHDLLLQLLGEGRLTDEHGHPADFRNSVIVMTSNLGGETFNSGRAGFGHGPSGAAQHFDEHVRAFMRPELYGRIDAIVAFSPLDAPTIHSLVGSELSRIGERDGARLRNLELEVDPAAVAEIARLSFDVRYGARHLKRNVEREVLAPLAAGLARLPEGGALAEIFLQDGVLDVRVSPRGSDDHREHRDALAAQAERCGIWRRRLATFADSPRWHALMSGLAEESAGSDRTTGGTARTLRLRGLRRFSQEYRELEAELQHLEEDLIVAVVCGQPVLAAGEPAALIDTFAEEATLMCRQVLRLEQEQPDSAGVTVRGSDPESVFALARAYSEVADRIGLQAQCFRVGQEGTRGQRRATLTPVPLTEIDPTEESGLVTLLLELTGVDAFIHVGTEGGLHELRSPKDSTFCLIGVRAGPASVEQLLPVSARPPQPTGSRRRRVYDRGRNRVEDEELGVPMKWVGRRLADALERTLAASMEARVQGIFET